MTFDELKVFLCAHQQCSRNVVYTIPVPLSDSKMQEASSIADLAKVVTSMVACTAFPGSQQFQYIESSCVVEFMLRHGFLVPSENHSNEYQLTHKGLDGIVMYAEYRMGKPLAEIEMPKDDDTDETIPVHTLLQILEDDGWIWKRLPKGKRSIHDENSEWSYRIGCVEKVWRTNSTSVPSSYLRCLIQADDLKADHGITHIPHGCSAAFYTALLEGKITSQTRGAKSLVPDQITSEMEIDYPSSGILPHTENHSNKGKGKGKQLSINPLVAQQSKNSSQFDSGVHRQGFHTSDNESDGAIRDNEVHSVDVLLSLFQDPPHSLPAESSFRNEVPVGTSVAAPEKMQLAPLPAPDETPPPASPEQRLRDPGEVVRLDEGAEAASQDRIREQAAEPPKPSGAAKLKQERGLRKRLFFVHGQSPCKSGWCMELASKLPLSRKER